MTNYTLNLTIFATRLSIRTILWRKFCH